MIKNIIDIIDIVENNFKKVISFLTVCSTLIGGLILLKYSIDINYIPINFSLSDVFSLTVFSLIFGAFSLFVFLCFWLSSGLILHLISILITNSIAIKITSKILKEKLIVSILNKYKISKVDVVFNATIAFFTFIFLYFYLEIFSFSDFFAVNGIIISLRVLYKYLKLQIVKNSLESDVYDKIKYDKKLFSMYCFIIPIILLFFIFPKLNLVVHIMNFADVRNYNVDIHIKEPYYHQFQECNMPLQISSFGDKYRKIENVNIDLQNVDRNIVVNIKHKTTSICDRVIIKKLDDNVFVIDKREPK
ncbi:MAG: hypothetical protein Q3971_00415 [Moraxella sp.]|nr:hypothetical protein [Moraxella sp.]